MALTVTGTLVGTGVKGSQELELLSNLAIEGRGLTAPTLFMPAGLPGMLYAGSPVSGN